MAKKDFSKLTITSIPDPSSGGYSIYEYKKDMESIVSQAIKSALPENEYFKVSSRIVDKQTGELKMNVYFHSDNASLMAGSIGGQLEHLAYRDSATGKLTQNLKYELSQGSLSNKELNALIRDEESRNKASAEDKRFTKGAMLKAVALLTTVVDITRRILSSVIAFSAQTVKDFTSAHNLGLSYESIRNYRHIEQRHNMKEGTISEAVAGEQQKYGNITSLDEKSLEYIALIMGSKVEEMATMGIGASNPEAIVEAIVDRANELANAGYNSIGQYVGEQQARRELYSYLLKYSPQIADIFATMQEEHHNINSIFRNQLETFAQLKGGLPTARNTTPAEYNVVVTLGEEWGVFKEVMSQIKESIMANVAPTLLKILRRLSNLRIGMSQTEKEQLNKANKQANEEFIASSKATMRLMEREAGGDIGNLPKEKRARYYALKDAVAEAEKANKGGIFGTNIPNAVLTPDELQVMTEAKIRQTERGENYIATSRFFDNTGARTDVTDEEIKSAIEGSGKYDVDTISRFRNKLYQEKLEKARAEAEEKRKAKIRDTEVKALEDVNADTSSLTATTAFNDKLTEGYQLIRTAELLFNVDLTHDEKSGKELSIKEAIDRAVNKGYIARTGRYKYRKLRLDKEVPTDKIDPNVIQDEVDREYLRALYESDPYWFNAIIAEKRGDKLVESSYDDPYYDISVLYRDWGANLEGLAKLIGSFSGSRDIITSDTRDSKTNDVIHRLIVDINNNGRIDAEDKEIASWTTNRELESRSVASITYDNGKVTLTQAQGTPASKGK